MVTACSRAGVAQLEPVLVKGETIGKEAAGTGLPRAAPGIGLPSGQERDLFPDIRSDRPERAIQQIPGADIANQRRRLLGFGHRGLAHPQHTAQQDAKHANGHVYFSRRGLRRQPSV